MNLNSIPFFRPRCDPGDVCYHMSHVPRHHHRVESECFVGSALQRRLRIDRAHVPVGVPRQGPPRRLAAPAPVAGHAAGHVVVALRHQEERGVRAAEQGVPGPLHQPELRHRPRPRPRRRLRVLQRGQRRAVDVRPLRDQLPGVPPRAHLRVAPDADRAQGEPRRALPGRPGRLAGEPAVPLRRAVRLQGGEVGPLQLREPAADEGRRVPPAAGSRGRAVGHPGGAAQQPVPADDGRRGRCADGGVVQHLVGGDRARRLHQEGPVVRGAVDRRRGGDEERRGEDAAGGAGVRRVVHDRPHLRAGPRVVVGREEVRGQHRLRLPPAQLEEAGPGARHPARLPHRGGHDVQGVIDSHLAQLLVARKPPS
jgi:hypothetical protein